MARNENEYVVDPVVYHYEYFNVNGEQVPEENEEVCAKSVFNQHTGTLRFFVKFGDNRIYNPLNVTKREAKTIPWKWKKVTPKAFNLYLAFLETRIKRFIVQAERLI